MAIARALPRLLAVGFVALVVAVGWVAVVAGVGRWAGRTIWYPVVERLPHGSAAFLDSRPGITPPTPVLLRLIPRVHVAWHDFNTLRPLPTHGQVEWPHTLTSGSDFWIGAWLVLMILHGVATAALWGGLRVVPPAPHSACGPEGRKPWLSLAARSGPALAFVLVVPQLAWEAWLTCAPLLRAEWARAHAGEYLPGMPLALGAWGVAPIWLAGVLAYVACLWWVALGMRKAQREPGTCSACGYAADWSRGNQCSECGADRAAGPRRAASKQRKACGIWAAVWSLCVAGWCAPLLVAWLGRLLGSDITQRIGLF